MILDDARREAVVSQELRAAAEQEANLILEAAGGELESASQLRASAIQESIGLRSVAEREAAVVRAEASRDADVLLRRAQAELQAAMDLEASVKEGRPIP